MSNLNAAGANNLNIKSVHYVTYLQEPSSGPVHLIVNKNQYVGRYSTLANAQEALEGILMRLGSKDPTTRRGQITTVTTDLTFTGDVTPAAADWTTITHAVTYDTGIQEYSHVYGTAQVQITGIDTNIGLRVLFSNPSTTTQLWVNVSPTTVAANTTTPPSSSTGYTRLYNNSTFVVKPNEFVRFKAMDSSGAITNFSSTITVTNTSNVTTLDTFTLAYTYSEIGGV